VREDVAAGKESRAVQMFFGMLHKLADELLWLGDSLAAMRVYDVVIFPSILNHFDFWDESERMV